ARTRAHRGAARAGRPDRSRRAAHEDLLGRDEAPPRPRERPRPQSRRAVSRRAHDGPRPGLADDDLGGGAADQRRRRDDLPDHPVPRGGRPALRPPRDHRRRRIVAEGAPEELKAEMGHDVVTVSLDGADHAATEAALCELPGLERVAAEPNALALYIENDATAIAEIVRCLDSESITVGAISVARPSLDDVFLKATGRRLEGSGDDGEETQEGER